MYAVENMTEMYDVTHNNFDGEMYDVAHNNFDGEMYHNNMTDV